MHRNRITRKRLAALALLPFAALTASNAVAAATTADSPPVSSQPLAATATASGVELKLDKRHSLTGSRLKLKGTVAPGGARTVEIDVNGKKVKQLKTEADGSFHGKWRTGGPGVYKVKAVVKQEGAVPVQSAAKRVNVYRAVQASYYGPGLYGNGLACGGTLSPGTLGVANKTLPCGTKVTLRKGRRTVTVEVIDRGPYVGNRVYDLTAATKNKLGFGSTGIVLATK